MPSVPAGGTNVFQTETTGRSGSRLLPRRRDDHRLGGTRVRAVEHRLDIVAVGIVEEGGVVARMVAALARAAIVGAAGGEAGFVQRRTVSWTAAWKARWTRLDVSPWSHHSSSAKKKVGPLVTSMPRTPSVAA